MKVKNFRTTAVFLAVAALILLAFTQGARGQTTAALAPIYTFTGGADGGNPIDGLIQGSDGNLYGTTAPVADGHGTVFKITSARVLTTLYTFTGGADGARPRGGLTQGSDGNLYGTACEGGSGNGANGYGTVFKITPAGVLTTLYTFSGGADGASPWAGLTQGSDGSFYGTTSVGGHGDGTVFKITPAGVFSALYAFTGGADGADPLGALTQGSDGNFYGTTNDGGSGNGSHGYGTVFRITPAGVLTTLYTFLGGADGASPFGRLTQGSDGSFYGTTEGGRGDGTVFKTTPAGVFTALYAFTGGADGAYPVAGLTQGNDGNFYGTTCGGGSGDGHGTVFKITPAGVLSTLYSFTGGADGSTPQAALTRASDGNFYSTTTFKGGASGDGTVFTLTVSPIVKAKIKLH